MLYFWKYSHISQKAFHSIYLLLRVQLSLKVNVLKLCGSSHSRQIDSPLQILNQSQISIALPQLECSAYSCSRGALKGRRLSDKIDATIRFVHMIRKSFKWTSNSASICTSLFLPLNGQKSLTWSRQDMERLQSLDKSMASEHISCWTGSGTSHLLISKEVIFCSSIFKFLWSSLMMQNCVTPTILQKTACYCTCKI